MLSIKRNSNCRYTSTFSRRGMIVTKDYPIGLTDEFANDVSRQSIWLAFLKKNDLEIMPLPIIVEKIRNHLSQPLMQAALLNTEN